MKKKIYENVPSKKFDLFYDNRTLNRRYNSHISFQEKINSLISVVKESGEIYLHYLMAVDEDDNEKYPINLLFIEKNKLHMPNNEERWYEYFLRVVGTTVDNLIF